MKQPGLCTHRDARPTVGDGIDTRVDELATLLFDLRAAHEADIRALTWIQRNLEGVRTGRAPGDTDLLLGEMARMFGECQACASDVTARREAAVTLLLELIADRKQAIAPKPVAIFAA
jgi:hypothetical protein